MLNKMHAVALAAAMMIPGHRLASQSEHVPLPPEPPCGHCVRPTPFEKTQGVAVIIMVREEFANRAVDAVIRDEPERAGKPLIAVKRGALSPELVYRALASLAQSRVRHNGAPPARATTLLSSGSSFQEVPDEDQGWVANLVSQLSSAPIIDIAGVGRFPAVTLTIDKNTLRAK